MSDDGLFREVDEEVRREKATEIWNRFGTLIVAACLAVVLGVGGHKAWQYWQAQQAEKAGLAWYEAMQLSRQGKSAEAEAAYAEISGSGHAGYSVLAKMSQAAALGQDGKTDEAIKLYDEVVAQASADKPLREAARVRAAYLLVDSASVEDLTSRLEGLAGDNSSWRHAVREILALANVRAGNIQAADEQVKKILADPATPAALRTRSALVAAQIKVMLPASAAN